MDTTTDQAASPKAFLSHSSKDKDRFVLPFAGKLREEFGIDVWVDKWEIRPGDSFVDRIFNEGIGEAGAFLVVISTNSVDSPWVRDELDAGTVDRIEQGRLLIPLILDGLEKEAIPKQLQHLHWIRIEELAALDAPAEQVARTIFGHDPLKPPLGLPPEYTLGSVSIPGMSPADVVTLMAIGDRGLDSQSAFVGNPESIREEVASLGVDDEAFSSSVKFLHEHRLLDKDTFGLSGIQVLALSRRGVGTYLRARQVDLDALERKIIAHIVNHPQEQHRYKDLANTLDAQPLAVAHIIDGFDLRGLAMVVKAGGDTLEVGEPSETLRRMVR